MQNEGSLPFVFKRLILKETITCSLCPFVSYCLLRDRQLNLYFSLLMLMLAFSTAKHANDVHLICCFTCAKTFHSHLKQQRLICHHSTAAVVTSCPQLIPAPLLFTNRKQIYLLPPLGVPTIVIFIVLLLSSVTCVFSCHSPSLTQRWTCDLLHT